MKVGEAASRVGVQVYHTGQGRDERAHTRLPPSCAALTRRGLEPATHTGSRERGGGLRQTLECQELQRVRLTAGRTDATGTAWAAPLEHRFPALARDLAALRAPRGAQPGGVTWTQATCCRGA